MRRSSVTSSYLVAVMIVLVVTFYLLVGVRCKRLGGRPGNAGAFPTCAR